MEHSKRKWFLLRSSFIYSIYTKYILKEYASPKFSVVLQLQGQSNLCYTNDTTLIVSFAEIAKHLQAIVIKVKQHN